MRRGTTLIELLVVIFIVLTVTALAIPIIAPALRGRQVREASRIVTAYLAGARTEAMKSGRATGVIFETLPDSPEWCFNLSQCKVPPPYSGDTMDSTVALTVTGGFNAVVPMATIWLDPTDPLARVKPGDLIQFNFQGHKYRLNWNGTDWFIGTETAPGVWSMDSETATQPVVSPLVVRVVGMPPVVVPSSYQIFRQPRRSSTAPVQLPSGIVIDLNYSGDDAGPFVIRDHGTNFTGTPYELDPYVGAVVPPIAGSFVAVVFAPDGSVQRVYRNDATGAMLAIRPTGPIHFLLGQRARVPVSAVETLAGVQALEGDDDAQLETFNFIDLTNYWVTVNPRSGKIGSTENAVSQIPSPLPTPVIGPIADAVRASRTFAADGQDVGGP